MALASYLYFSRKSFAPEKAIWLIYLSISSAVKPMPRSEMVIVSLPNETCTVKSPNSPLNSLIEASVFNFCVASTALEAITKIIDIELKGLYDRIDSIGYKLVIEDKAKQFIASKGYDVQYGARPLKRAIQAYLEDGLSELIISASLKEGDTITVSLNEEKGELEMNHEAKTTE